MIIPYICEAPLEIGAFKIDVFYNGISRRGGFEVFVDVVHNPTLLVFRNPSFKKVCLALETD